MLNRRDSLSCDMDEETRPYVVCFVGLEKTLETQLSELVPDAHILRFTTPALSALHIDNAALDLLKYLYDNYTLADHQDGWRSVVLVGKGVASFIVKQAMNLASTQEQYRELALMVSDLVFIETPHRTFPKGPSWSSVLEAMLSPDLLPLQDEFVSRIKLICGSFLLTAKKHRISNILAASSNLRINEYDCRIFDYWLETNIHLTADLVASDLSDRFDDLHRVRRVLSQPDVQKEKSRFPTSAYIDFLSDLSWSWRQPGDYGYRENKRFTVDAHSLHTQPDGISLPLQLVGPAGCGKKTMLRHLADTRSRSLQSTAVILVKEDFCSFNPLQKDVLKSMISQILWQRPFVFPHLQAYLDTASDIEIPTEPMLWNVLRFLCHPGRIGTLYLYIADISDSPLVLRPLLQFLQSSESPANLCVVSTSKAVDLTNLPADTRVIDVLDDCDWDQGILTVIDALLPMYPWLEETALQCEVKEKLRQCTGDYLTAYLYLKQVSRVTAVPTPASICQSLERLARDRELIYGSGISSIVNSGHEIALWCSQALSWVLYSCRPLTVQELSVAVAISNITPGSSMAEAEKHITVGMWEVLSQHLGLFLRRDGNVVLLVNETTRDSLLSFQSDTINFLGHDRLAQLCLEYLLFFLPTETDSTLEGAGKGTFLAYAARYWHEHFLLAGHNGPDTLQENKCPEESSSLDALIGSLLSSSSLRNKWYRLFHSSTSSHHAANHLDAACELGLLAIVERSLDARGSREAPDTEMQNSLQYATASGHERITRLLIDSGGAVSPSLPVAVNHNRLAILQQLIDSMSESGTQPEDDDVAQSLCHASSHGSLEALTILTGFVKAKMPDFDLFGTLPLERAAARGHAEVVEFLLQELKEARASSQLEEQLVLDTFQQKTTGALHVACTRGDEGLVHRLLRWGIGPTVRGLEISAELGHTTIVKSLLTELSANHADNTWLLGSCALLNAAQSGCSDVVNMLVEAGSPIGFALDDGDTALHMAIRHGHKDIVEYLVNNGAERQRLNTDNVTPAHIAAQHGYVSIFKTVQENPQPETYTTYLATAAEHGQVLFLRYLLRLGRQSISESEEMLVSALVTAASKGYLAAVRELHQANVDVNRRTGVRSALHEAGCNGHHHVVEYLLSQGADANARDEFRRTPLHESVKYPVVMSMMIHNASDVEATDSDDLTPLHMAVRTRGDVPETTGLEDSIHILLDAGADAAVKDEDNNTALHLAAQHSFLQAANIVLGQYETLHDTVESLINSTNSEDQTALHIAAQKGDSSFLAFLLEKGASMINTRDSKGRAPLQHATEAQNIKCINLLVDRGAEVNGQDNTGKTALNIAAAYGDSEIVEFLLDKRANTEIANEKQQTPLISAVEDNHLGVARALLDRGASIKAVDDIARSSLHVAAEFGHLELARLLLDRGADSESFDSDGWTPLFTAVEFDNFEIATTLVGYGVNIEASDSSGWSPLELSCNKGMLDFVGFFVNNGADIEHTDNEAWTPLAAAVATGQDEVVRFLMARGANIEASTSLGWRPVNLASFHGHPNIVRLLLEHKVDIDAATTWGYTALGSAAENGHYEVARLLIEHGALVEASDKEGKTPLIIACSYGHLEILKLLLAHGAHLDVVDIDGWTPLHYAIRNEHLDIARYLLEQVDVNAKTSSGRTPLSEAVIRNQPETVRLLIQNGANCTASDEDGFTALHLAIRLGALEAVAILLEHSPGVLTYTDLFGKTPVDWVPVERAEAFFAQNPSLSQYQPTSQKDREAKTNETLIHIITQLEQPNTPKKYNFLYRLRSYFTQLGDISSALRCTAQTAFPGSNYDMFGNWAWCYLCNGELKDHGYFCTTCIDVDFCKDCLAKQKENPSVLGCFPGHEFQEVQAPEHGTADNGVETLEEFLADMRAKYGTA